MNNTLDMMNQLIWEEDMDKTLEQIIDEYKYNLSPSLLALAFTKVYGLIASISTNFYGLNPDDISSIALAKLDESMLKYNPNESKFTTYFTVNLRNAFRYETQQLNTHKRKAVFHSSSYELMVDNGFELVAAADHSEHLDILSEVDLTCNEVKYCNLLVDEYTNAEISEIIGVSVMTLSNWRKKLQLKLSY